MVLDSVVFPPVLVLEENCAQEQDLQDRSDCKRLCGVHLEILEQEVGDCEEKTR